RGDFVAKGSYRHRFGTRGWVPKLDSPIQACSGDLAAIRTKSQCCDRARVAAKRLNGLPDVAVPKSQRTIGAGSRQEALIGAKRDAANPVLVAGQTQQLFARVRIEDSGYAVPAGDR